MYRVLWPVTGWCCLATSPAPTGRCGPIQRVIERWLLPVAGDHQTREPLPLLRAAGFVIDREERSRAGVIQRLVATKHGDR